MILKNYRPDIDGLRAIAVLSVLLFHAGYPAFSGGFVGVDVFFVISGYLITGFILNDQNQSLTAHLKDFYARRIRRIFPALIVVIAASLVAGWFWLLPPDYVALAKQALAGAFFVPNFLFWSEAGYFDKVAELKPLLHLWSLGIEEQFYLVWPIAIFTIKRTRLLRPFLFVVTIASFAYCVYLTASDPNSAYYLPFSRMWELTIGGLIAAISFRSSNTLVNNALSVFGLSAILWSVVAISPSDPFPGAIAAIPTLGAAALIWSGPSTFIASRLLSIKPAIYIGLISYPLYLWHWPLLSFARQLGWPISTWMVLAASVALASITYEFIERPLKSGRFRPFPFPLLAGMGMVAACGFAVVISAGVYWRYPIDSASILKTLSYDYGPDGRLYECWLVDEKGSQQYPPECTSPNGKDGILIVGDSHAARLYPGLLKAFPNNPVWQITRSGCLPLGGSSLCNQTRDYALQIAKQQHPKYVILFAAWLNHSEDWSGAAPLGKMLASTIEQFVSTGTHVVVLGPAPIWKPSLPQVAYNEQQKSGKVPFRIQTGRDVSAVDREIQDIATRNGAAFVSVNDTLCNDLGCLVRSPSAPDLLTSWDYGHLTTAGATFVAEQLFSSIVKSN